MTQRETWIPEESRFEVTEERIFYGIGYKISTLEDVKITYAEEFSYFENDPDSFLSAPDLATELWDIEGIRVIDWEGLDADIQFLIEALYDRFVVIDYSELLSKIAKKEDRK